MTTLSTASGAIFRGRDVFVHDGRQLRRLRLSSNLQILFAVALGLLIAFSTYSLVRVFTPAAAPVTIAAVSTTWRASPR